MKSTRSVCATGGWMGVTALVGLGLWLSRARCEEAGERKSSPDSLNMYADAASFQNNNAFELAAEEWEKFLHLFPKDPLADKARHYAGVCQLQLKRFDRAAVHFADVVAQGTKFELAEDAHLNLGWCQYSLGLQGKTEMYARAVETFAKLAKLFPQGKYLDQSLFYQGESLYALAEKEKAVDAYKRLIEKHVQSPLRREALYALGVAYEDLKRYPEAEATYDRFLKDYANDNLAAEVRLRRGEAILQRGEVAAAEKVFAELAAIPGSASADYAVLRQAYCAARQEQYDEAGKLYARIPNEFPRSTHVAEASLSAGRCFYRAQKYDAAVPWLERVVENSGSEAPEAAHWLCRIYLNQKAGARAVELVERVLPKAGEGPYQVQLSLDQADALYSLSEWRADSVAKYLQIVADHPQHELAPQALYNAAFACWELKNYDDGLRHSQAFLEKYPEHALAPDVKHVAAECQIKKAAYAEAESRYRNLVKEHAPHESIPAWRIRLGLVLYFQKKYDQAIDELTALVPQLKEADQLAEAGFLLGGSYFHQGNYDEAEKALAASLVANPKSRQADEALLFLSRVQHKKNQLDEAQQTIRRLMADFPESPLLDQAYYRLGEYRYAGNDFKGAITAYETLVAKWSSSTFVPFAYYGKGWAELKCQQYAAGADSFSTLIERYPQHEVVSAAHFARAMCYRQMGQHRQSLGDVAVYLKSDPPPAGRADAFNERGLSEIAAGDTAAAVETFETLLREYPDDANAASVLYELAWAYKKLDKRAESVAAFSKLASQYESSPLAAEAHWRVGEDYFDRGEFSQAIEAYQQAKQKATPSEVHELALHKLGWAFFRMDNLEPALEQFREQVQAYPDSPWHADALFMQGECLFKLERWQDALTAFSAASQTTPTKPQMQVLTLLHAGQSAAELRRWAECLRYLDQIPAKHPDTPYLAEALGKRGWAKQNLNRIDDAIQDYEQAASQSRGEAGAHARFLLGEIQFERKQYQEAVKSFLRAMYGYGGDNATQEVKHWQAMAAFEAGRCTEVQMQQTRDPQTQTKLVADARTYFGFVVQRHPDHELAAQAQRRLETLANL